MIERRVLKLAEPCKSKVKVLMKMVKRIYPKFRTFETLRTKERQAWLYKNNKTRTLNSMHLKGLACDFVFVNSKWQPTRVGNYDYVHYIGKMCGMTGIYKNGKLLEECHLQDDGRTLDQVIKNNSDRYNSITNAEEQELLHQCNLLLRRYV